MKKLIYIIVAILVTSAGVNAQNMFSITYDVGVPLGSTSDFIGSSSFRGFGLEGRVFIKDNLSYGGSFNWAVFYEEFGPQEWNIEGQNGTAYGKQFRYINSFPIMATMHYYIGDYDATRIYVGGGIGPQKIDQRTDIGLYSVNKNKWRLGLAPEIGVLIPVNFNSRINIAARYQYAVKAGDNEAVSYLNIKVGFAFL